HETTLVIGISLGFGIWSFSKSRMKWRSMLTAAIMLAVTAQAEELPRKSKTPRETYPRVDVIYDSVTAPDGTRLRTIITKPRGANDKLPVVFVAVKNYDFIDANRIYILGISNGGGFAPLVPESDAEQAQVRGYISIGGWVKTWFEHMLEIERRRFALMGKSPGEVNDRMKSAATLYHEWLIEGRSVDDILKEQPQLADLWPEGKDHTHLYGRPLAFYQQLQKLNLGVAWSRVKVPTYVLRGAFDWIMSREDSELISTYVNKNGDLASFYEIPDTGHTFQHYLSLADAFKGKKAPFDPKMIGLLADWLQNKAITHED